MGVRAWHWCALVAAAAGLFAACQVAFGEGDKAPRYVRDGTAELDLTVTGRPIPETLAVVEQAVVRLKERDAEGLAGLARESAGADATAREWVKEWGAAAHKPVVADFADDSIDTWTVELRFKGESEPLALDLRHRGEGRGEGAESVGIEMTEGYYD
ncbi:hypothetical protein [Streptomyces sp. NPDC047123]|uniref:hypothetical protein n=1 Tax=Streptomyces sp. NPDC047123 TaxID=3155622 RepID=UPI0033ED599B